MMLVNTTFVLDEGLRDAFLEWVCTDYAAQARDAGASSLLLLRVIDRAEAAPGALSYACQFQVADMESAEAWVDRLSQPLLWEAASRWGERLLHFSTIMEVLP